MLSTSPHPLDPRRVGGPGLRLEVAAGPPPGPDDASRLFRDEAARSLALAEGVTA